MNIVAIIGSPHGMAGNTGRLLDEVLCGFARARRLGEDLIGAVREKPRFPEQDAFHDAFRERMRRLMEYRKGDWTYEYDYWRARGIL